jgi:hypothetical protein
MLFSYRFKRRNVLVASGSPSARQQPVFQPTIMIPAKQPVVALPSNAEINQ